jgi:hypothetical protein
MARTLTELVIRIREELRAEGADGSGYSDPFVIDNINEAIVSLAKDYPIRTTRSFNTTVSVNSYNLATVITAAEILNIMRVEYDGALILPIALDDYLAVDTPTTGEVSNWVVWGKNLILTGAVPAGKAVTLWVTETPTALTAGTDKHQLPTYFEPAIIQYVVAACYRESRDYDRASAHFRIFQYELGNLLSQAIPQTQRAEMPQARSSYFGPISERRGEPLDDGI